MAGVEMAAATAAAVALAKVAFVSRPEPRYLLAREDGGVIPIVAVTQPFFAVEAVTAAMTMDFTNWREDLSEASGYFEKPGGWRNFPTYQSSNERTAESHLTEIVDSRVLTWESPTSVGITYTIKPGPPSRSFPHS